MMMETDVMECGVWVMMENLIEVGSILAHRLVVRPMTCPSSTTLLMPSWHSNQMGEKTLQRQLCKHLCMWYRMTCHQFNNINYQSMVVMMMFLPVCLCLSPAVEFLVHHNKQKTCACKSPHPLGNHYHSKLNTICITYHMIMKCLETEHIIYLPCYIIRFNHQWSIISR